MVHGVDDSLGQNPSEKVWRKKSGTLESLEWHLAKVWQKKVALKSLEWHLAKVWQKNVALKSLEWHLTKVW